MRNLHTTLVSPQQPAFQQRHNAIYPWQQILPEVTIISNNLMRVAYGGQTFITVPSISTHGTPRIDTITNSSLQAWPRRICYALKANSPNLVTRYIYHNNNQCLPCSSSASFPGFRTSDVGFIDFYSPGKTIPSRAHHGTPEFMQPTPGRMITAHTKHPLQSKRIRSIFLTCQMPDSPKPQSQGLFGILKNRICNNRSLKATLSTMQQSSFCPPRLSVSTMGTLKSFRPSNLKQVFAACLLRVKLFFKFQQCFWIVLHEGELYI